MLLSLQVQSLHSCVVSYTSPLSVAIGIEGLFPWWKTRWKLETAELPWHSILSPTHPSSGKASGIGNYRRLKGEAYWKHSPAATGRERYFPVLLQRLPLAYFLKPPLWPGKVLSPLARTWVRLAVSLPPGEVIPAMTWSGFQPGLDCSLTWLTGVWGWQAQPWRAGGQTWKLIRPHNASPPVADVSPSEHRPPGKALKVLLPG